MQEKEGGCCLSGRFIAALLQYLPNEYFKKSEVVMGKTKSVVTKQDQRRYEDGVADAEEVPRCKKIIREVEEFASATAESGDPRLPTLVEALREWLGTNILSGLKKEFVLEKDETGALRWCRVFENQGEIDRARQSTVSRWLNGTANCPFSSKTATRLAWCCIQNKFWGSTPGPNRPLMEHEYYHQLLDKLGSSATTHGNLTREAPGIYQCFRPSCVYPGRYVFGLFAVAALPDVPKYSNKTPTAGNGKVSRVLRTIELHRFSPTHELLDTSPNGIPAIPDVTEITLGYMVKKSRQVLCHAFDSVTGSFQYTVISNFLLGQPSSDKSDTPAIIVPQRELARIQMMSGISVGLVGQLGFFSVPTVLLRVADVSETQCNNDADIVKILNDQLPKRTVGILPEKEIPEFVMRQFKAIERQVVSRLPGGDDFD